MVATVGRGSRINWHQSTAREVDRDRALAGIVDLRRT
jgi:hypothetical protein